jgi:hypothetical protein
MGLEQIIYSNSIPLLERELHVIKNNFYSLDSTEEQILSLQKEMMLKIRIRQVERMIQQEKMFY